MIKNLKHIDVKDQRIIQELLKDARQSISTIAGKVSLSKEVVAYRMHALEDKKIIRAYRTLIEYKSISMQIFEIIIKLNKPLSSREALFFNLSAYPEVLGLSSFIGEFDYNIIIAVKNNAQLSFFVNKIKEIFAESLHSIHILINTSERYMLASSAKTTDVVLHDSDTNLLSLLIHNSRISFKDISKKTSYSYPYLSQRVRLLEKKGVIKAFYADIDFTLLGMKEYGIYLKIPYLSEKEHQVLLSSLESSESVYWYCNFIGEYDLGIAVILPEEASLSKFLDEFTKPIQKMILELKSVSYQKNKK